jgi:hypothetical protein
MLVMVGDFSSRTIGGISATFAALLMLPEALPVPVV